MTRASRILLAVCVVLGAGCSESTNVGPLDLGGSNTGDSGSPDDGGDAVDSGALPDGDLMWDGGDTSDAGGQSEGGVPGDAGDPVDAGLGDDGGGPVDAGLGDDGGFPIDAGIGSDGGPACDADGALSRAFVVRSMRVASSSVGANIDGLDNSSTPNSVAGCRKGDAAGGIENALAGVDSIAMNIPSEVMQSGLTAGDIALTFTVSSWNGTADDDCIDVDLSGIGLVGGLSVRTGIASGVIDTVFATDTGWDITGSYGGTSLTVPLRGLRAHLVLDGSLTELVLPTSPTAATASFIAGYVLYLDSAAPLTSSDLRPRVLAFVNAIGYGALASTIDSTAVSLRDLHTVDGLRPCMNPGSVPTVVDSDSLSASLLISSNPP